MVSWMRQQLSGRYAGFTLTELALCLMVIGILMTAAMPAYVSARKNVYRGEAHNILQEIKTLEWAYYQQYNLFDISGTLIGFAAPGGMHWAVPTFSGDAGQSVQILMSGCGVLCSPMGTVDQVSLTLMNDGSSATGSTF